MALSTEVLQRLAGAAFPEARLIAQQPLPPGVGKSNYWLQLQSPTAEVVLRLYSVDAPRHQIDKEMHVLRVVMPETGVPTRRVIHFDGSHSLIDRPFALLNHLPGEPLDEVLPRMDDLDQEAVGYELGRYLAKLHHAPLDRFGEFFGADSAVSGDEKGYTLSRLADWLAECQANSLLTSSLAAEIQRQVAQAQALDRARACLVHGQFYGGNILVEAGVAGFHVTAVLNLERAQGWSPEWDMAGLAVYVLDDRPAMAKGFFDGYTDAAALPDHFWQRMSLYRLLVSLWGLVEAHRRGDLASREAHVAGVHRSLAKGKEGQP
ncbi:MAG: phosphotransferase family protein [Chloroflexota bacterium]